MNGRIVHLCYGGTSGAATVAMNIAAGSADPGRHAYVLYGAGPMRADYGADLDARGCRWLFVPKRPGLDVRAYRRAAEAILALSPAAAILHGSRTAPVAWWLKVLARRLPIVGVQHGPWREITQCRRRWVCAALGWASTVSVAVSNDLAALIRSRPLTRWATNPLRVIVNGLDADFWRADPPAIDPGRPLRIGMVAMLEDYKDHRTLLKAMAILRRSGRAAELELIGSGPREGDLRALAVELKMDESVHFRGTLSGGELRSAVHGLDILAHISASESFGMAVVEGMLSARPVVATDVPGVREVIEQERTGLRVRPGDADGLAAAIGRLADDPALATRLGIAARDKASETYSAARMAAEYERLVDEICRLNP